MLGSNEFLQRAVGGELVLQTVGEMPAMAAHMPPEFKDRILHSVLTSGDLVIMASDLSRDKRLEGNTVQLCVNCTSEEELNNFFTKLSTDGKIIEALIDMPWGGKFGALIDKFGKH